MMKTLHDTTATRAEFISAKLPKAARKALLAKAVRHYKADRLAYKASVRHNATVRAQRKPGPVIHRLELVRKMNEEALAAFQEEV
jgi:hypothetical protein